MASETDIPETGAIFTFGRSRFAGNEPSRFWVRDDRILHLACGDEHTALVTESGRIFMFGLNEWGQLGLGDTIPRDKPSCIKDLKSEKITLVACGRSHTIVTTASGHLYTFGCNGEYQLGVKDVDQQKTPIQVNNFPPNTEFKMVAAGVDHSVCLTKSGDVYVWGGNSEGQLGTGSADDKHIPTLLSVGEPIISISVGYYHTALLTRSGSALVFGEVDCGKLGLGNNIKSCRHPQKLSLGDVQIQSIACGGSHTVFLTNKKEVFSCGNGENGQLGHGPSKHQISVPEKLNLPFKVTAICCGENHTALLSDEGYLYTCGDGRHGKLGQGKDNYSNQFEPSRLLKFDPFIVDMVSCGGCHMMVLARHRSVQNGFTLKDIPKLSLDGNQTLLENTLELSGSLSARDRRRQTADSSFSSLSRTLPSLSGKSLSPFHNSMSPTLEVRHLPRLKNSQLCEDGAKTNMDEDRNKKEPEQTIVLNKNLEKSFDNQNNVQQSELQKPKVAPRTLRNIEVKNGSLINEKTISDVKEESHNQILDIGKKIEEEKENDFQQNIENVNNLAKSSSEKNGFSQNLNNGNAISTEIRLIENQAPMVMSQNKEKKKKKRKKKEEKRKDNDKRKTKESPESKVESEELESEELDSGEEEEEEEVKPKKAPRKFERKKSKKQKENKRKSEEEEEEETEEVEDKEEKKKSKKHQNSPIKKNSKLKDKKRTKEKKAEEDEDDDDEDDGNDDDEVEENRLKEKMTEDNDDDKDVETKNADRIDKLVFAEDLKPKTENQGEDKSKKSNTCNIL